MSWSILIGVPLGCYAAVRRGSAIDRIDRRRSRSAPSPFRPSSSRSTRCWSSPSGCDWFPAIGAGEPGDLGNQLWHLVLPSLAVGLGWVGYLARMVRASMLEVLGENHIRMARAFGLPERTITYHYALRLAILPTLTVLGIGVGSLLSSAVFAEIVFARPGIGKLDLRRHHRAQLSGGHRHDPGDHRVLRR